MAETVGKLRSAAAKAKRTVAAPNRLEARVAKMQQSTAELESRLAKMQDSIDRIEAKLSDVDMTATPGASVDELQTSVDRVESMIAESAVLSAKDRSGMRLPGTTAASVNPYEQELEVYQDRFMIPFERLVSVLPEVNVVRNDLSYQNYIDFLEHSLPDHGEIAKAVEHKKKQELFISFSLLRSGPEVSFMDAAGGGFSYLRHIEAREKYLQDLEIRKSVKKRVGPEVNYIEDSLGAIPLPDGSLDSISCHHAFEHFQGNVDVEFVQEVQRVLAPGGSACIVPIFLSVDHVEMTCFNDFDNWSGDDRSVRVVDVKSTLPGMKSGGYARVYSVDTFRERVLGNIDLERFEVSIVECTMDGKVVPNPKTYWRHKVSNFNFPYRALMITRSA